MMWFLVVVSSVRADLLVVDCDLLFAPCVLFFCAFSTFSLVLNNLPVSPMQVLPQLLHSIRLVHPVLLVLLCPLGVPTDISVLCGDAWLLSPRISSGPNQPSLRHLCMGRQPGFCSSCPFRSSAVFLFLFLSRMHKKKQLQSVTNNSTLIDDTSTENHLIDWEEVKVVDIESHRRRRHVKEAIWIRNTNAAINRDKGNYELPH